ncbi:FCD domain-containing protein [Salinibacterium sp. TMP30]|uniref:FadR/GntR family transcriptional regulator n=1 Tax=Salinibacterium sp. TMP30 TaxID=3138237 RepID=UPI003139C27D
MSMIKRSSLSDQVTHELVAMIERQGIGVGSPLPSTGELASQFGVSVVVIREALSTLSGRGIIQRAQGKESVVARPGSEVLDSIFRTRMRQDSITLDEFQHCRAALEQQAAAEAASGIHHAEALQTLGVHLEAMSHADNDEALINADVAFHHSLAVLSGNRALVLLLEGLHTFVSDSLTVMYERIGPRTRSSVELSISNHREIAVAVQNGDRAGAIDAMRRHFETSSPHLDFNFCH